jgi:hypothetical protein
MEFQPVLVAGSTIALLAIGLVVRKTKKSNNNMTIAFFFFFIFFTRLHKN